MPFRKRRRQSRRARRAQPGAGFQQFEPRQMLAAGVGLQAQYFDNADLTGLVSEQLDAKVDFDWGVGSPVVGVAADTFSVRWSGQVEAEFTQAYDFIVNADDGARLWVNGQLLIDQFDSSNLPNVGAGLDLVAGRRYDLILEYKDVSGDAAVRLEWEGPLSGREVIPTDQLFPVDRGSIGVERFDNITGTSVADLTSDIHFPGDPNSVSTLDSFAISPNTGDHYGQRIRGLLHAPRTGAYRFAIAANESAELWLSQFADPLLKRRIASVDSSVASQDWSASGSQTSGVVHLVAGQAYYIEALHKEAVGSDHLAVGWQQPGANSIEIIDGQYLSQILPDVRLFAESATTAEGSAASATLKVIRSNTPLNNPLTVRYTLRGSATNVSDFAFLPGVVTIPAGQTTATLVIAAETDSLVEGTEQVIVELRASTDYRVGLTSERTATVTIHDDVPLPAGGVSLFDDNGLSAFSAYGGTFTSVAVPEFENVIQASIPTSLPNVFSAQLQQAIDEPVVEGDLLAAEFYARSLAGVGQAYVVFELDGSPYTQSLGQGIQIGTEWEKVQIPFSPVDDYAVGEAKFSVQLGQKIQTLQFADIRLVNYGSSRDLLSPDGFYSQNLGGNFGVSQSIAVTGQDFTSGYELQTITAPPDSWRFQLYSLNEAGVEAGQTIQMSYWARSIAGATPQFEAILFRASDYATLGYEKVFPTGNWQQYSVEATVTEDFSMGDLQFNFHAGFDPQTVQIAGLEWTNLGQSLDFSALPSRYPAVTYGGRSGEDAWRTEADQRIAAERTATLEVNLQDANGAPLDGALVSVRQRGHDFLFGSAVSAGQGRLDPDGSDQALVYQREVKRLFNGVTDEYALQWVPLSADPAGGSAVANFADTNDLFMRGHSGIWPSRSWMPASVWEQYDAMLASQGTVAAENFLRTATSDRIASVASTYAALTDEWDVVNEPRVNNEVMQILGDGVVVDWFTQFRTLDPSARLALNEYDIFTNNGNNGSNLSNFQGWLDLLSPAGLVDVLGEQSHYTEGNLTDIPVLGTLIDDLHSANNLPINISELDVETKDEQLQADYLRDYLTMAFSQSGIEKIIQWGFWEGRHWRPDAALYRTDFSIKPNGQAYEDLVFGRWWTDVQGTTHNGSLETNAFLGEYEIVVQYQGQTFTSNFSHDGTPGQFASISVPVAPTPTVVEVVRDGGNETRPDQLQTIAVSFNTAVNVEADQLVLSNETFGGQIINTAAADFSYDANSRTATWGFSDVPNLDAAFYTVRLSENIDGLFDNAKLDGDFDGVPGNDFSQSIYVAIPGDANLDGDVDISDFDPLTFTNVGDASILLASLGTNSGATWSNGDFNGDGDVDVSQFDPSTFTNVGDASILLANLGRDVRPAIAASQFTFFAATELQDIQLPIAEERHVPRSSRVKIGSEIAASETDQSLSGAIELPPAAVETVLDRESRRQTGATDRSSIDSFFADDFV